MSDPQFKVALTIDAEHADQPRSEAIEPLLIETLRRERVRATFFLQGRWASANPGMVARISRDGHLVGNHSHHHAPMTLLSDDGIAADVTAAEQAITASGGGGPRPWFRCPYGDGHDDQRVLTVLSGLGYRDHHWDVDPRDWKPGRTESELVTTVLSGVDEHRDGAVVLLHSWPAVTARALPMLISELRRIGAQPVGLDEVVGS